MAQDETAADRMYVEALERELAGARRAGRDDKAAQVEAELRRVTGVPEAAADPTSGDRAPARSSRRRRDA
jgi:hypothetical protein